jgi:hypothetical protein
VDRKAVDVTTHPRTRALQAGAFLVLIGGVLVAAPSPAQAAPGDPLVTIDSVLKSPNLKAGDTATMQFTVTNTNTAGQEDTVSIAVSSTIAELSCDGASCNIPAEPLNGGEDRDYSVKMVAGKLASGASKGGQVLVRVTIGGRSSTDTKGFTVSGDTKSPTVREVSGTIRDQGGKAIGGALVAMTDSQSHQYTTNANGSGNYRFTSTDQNPIAVGKIFIGARKDGFVDIAKEADGRAGQSLNITLVMQSTTAPSPSATASASASASAKPLDDPTDEATSAPPAALEPTAGKADEDSGSMLFIIVGGLLVAAGVGAIVLVLMRRKENDAANDPDGDAALAGGARSGGVPPGQGRYGGTPDATRIAGRPSGRGADATMLAGPAVGASLADAPTMMQQAVPADPMDEFPDPYGAPAAVPHAGYAAARPGGWGTPPAAAAAGAYGGAAGAGSAYGAAAGTYGATAAPTAYGAPAQPGPAAYGNPPAPADNYGTPPASQYGRPPAPGGAYGGAAAAEPYGQPSSGAGYGGGAAPAGPGAYGSEQQRYDEPTGRYDPAAGGGAGAGGAVGGYRGESGYEQGGGYRPQEQGGGYRPEPGTGGFRPQASGGYPPPPEPEYPQPGRQQPGSGAPYQSGGGYPPAPGGYGTEPNDQDNAYGSWAPGGGIDSGNAYGAPAAPSGGYGRGGYSAPPTGGGYDEPTGFDPRAPYGRPEQSGRAPQPPGRAPQGGYDDPGYYGAEQPPQQGGRHGGQQPPPEPNPPGQRRPLDWLDD